MLIFGGADEKFLRCERKYGSHLWKQCPIHWNREDSHVFMYCAHFPVFTLSFHIHLIEVKHLKYWYKNNKNRFYFGFDEGMADTSNPSGLHGRNKAEKQLWGRKTWSTYFICVEWCYDVCLSVKFRTYFISIAINRVGNHWKNIFYLVFALPRLIMFRVLASVCAF